MGLIVRDIIKIGETRLSAAGVADAKADAEELFCFSQNISRSSLFMEWGVEISDKECDAYFELLDTRSSGTPTQYITGHQVFLDCDFDVTPDVLIPRLDTEVTVTEAVRVIEELGAKKVLDLCTGSGVIGICIDKMVSRADVKASDLSEAALAVAKRNSEKNGARVDFSCGDLFKPYKRAIGREKFDVIVSNPPYIPSREIENLMREVRDHEPHSALDGGADGLDFYRRIVSEAPEYLKKNGALVLEIGYDQGDAIRALSADGGRFVSCDIVKDLAGLDRVAILRL